MPLLRFLLLLPLYLLRLVGMIFQTILKVVGKILSPFVGQVQWQAPKWFAGVAHMTNRLEEFTKRYPLRIGAFLLVCIAAGIGGMYGYHWYQNRPGPIAIAPIEYQEAKVTLFKTPLPTDYRKENPTFDKLIIDFGLQAAPLETMKNAVTEGIELSPKMEGTWRWNVAGTQLIFTPKKDWAMAQKYTVSMTPQKLLAQTIKTETTSLEFKTEDMRLNVSESEFYQDPINPSHKKSIFHVQFNYPVDVASFEKSITLSMTTKKDKLISTPRFNVTYNNSKMDAWVHSEPITLPDDMSKMKLEIKKGVLSTKSTSSDASETSASIDIPSIYALKLNQIDTSVVRNEKNKYEQMIVVQASDAIKGLDLSRATSIWLLPQKHPERSHSGNYSWNQNDVTENILTASKRLDFKLAETDNEYDKFQSLAFNADPNRYVFVQFNFNKELQSAGGYKIKGQTSRVLRIKDYPSMLQFMSKGSILSLNGEQKISVAAQNVPGMKLEINRVAQNQLHHLVSFNAEPEFAHMNFNGYEKHFIERFTYKLPIKSRTADEVIYEGVDLKPYFSTTNKNKRGVFLLELRPWDIQKDREASVAYDSRQTTRDNRFVIITDIGIIAKSLEDGSSDVFIQSISTGQPVANATVSVIGKNGKAIAVQTSDISGHVSFKSLKDKNFTYEKEPLMYLVEKGDDVSFLPLTKAFNPYGSYDNHLKEDRSLNLSRFDVGGVKNTQEGELKAYLFSDRSLYRPGDTFNIGSIVKANKWGTSLKGLPILAEIYDSRNTLVRKQLMNLDESGLNELSHTTQESSPTGEWNIYLYLIKKDQSRTSLGYTTIQVKEFEPDRLNVAIKIEPKNGKQWLKPEELNASVAVLNLFGTPAQNLRVSTSMTLSPAAPYFAAFGDYTFYEDHSKTQTFKTKLEDTTTNKEGIANLKLGLESYAPASYYVQLLTEAFEAQSGRSVIATTKTLVSPYGFFIGAKADGDMSYISKDSPRSLHLIAVSPTVKPMAVSNLTLALVENTYVSVLTQQGSGAYKYESKLKEKVIAEQALSINEAGYTYALPTDKPGNYGILVKDSAGHVLYKTSFSIAGNANVTRSLERDAELKLTLSKPEYEAGETIEVAINAPYVGSGLITIERDKVYAWKWFQTTTTNSTQTIELPKGIDGNAYVNVQFLRDPNSNEIFMSPLSYGVMPFSINLEKHQSKIDIETPKLIKPGNALPIKVHTSEKQKVIVFAIDEGILQVARYTFQDPVKYFFKKKELSVESLQILDLILPEFAKLKELSAPGGDGKDKNALNMHLNPFKRKNNKPVTFWSGITEIDGEQTFKFDIPDYFNGKLRVMAIAVTPERIGAAQTTALIQDDFVLSPNAPYVVAPNDEFEVSLSVANNLETNGTAIPITIAASGSKHISIVENAKQTLSLAGKEEGVVRFKVKATAHLGSADMIFTASHGKTSITRKESLSVRPLVPYRTEVLLGQMSQKEETITNLRKMFDEYSKRTAALSHSPLVLTSGLSSYLESYPYECSEQIVSRAVPTLFLDSHPELATNDEQTLQYRLNKALDVLRTRQNTQGGFGMWRATIETDPFVSAYVVQFLLEAHEKGKPIPVDMLQKATKYLQSVASDENQLNDEYGLRLRAFATYLLTRQNKVTTNLISTIQTRLQNNFGEEWKNSLSALYLAASYKMLKMDKEANELLKGPWKNLEKAYSDAWWSKDFNDPLIQDATTLYIITKHFPEKVSTIPTKAIENMVLMLRGNRYTSLSSAMSILALEAYSQALVKSANATGELNIKAINSESQTRLISAIHGVLAQGSFGEKDAKLVFNNPNNLPAWYSISQEGFDQSPSTKAVKNGIEIVRTYTDAEGKKIDKVELGEKINVRISVRSLSKEAVENIAVVDLIPGGFELVQQLAPTAAQADEASESNEAGEGESEEGSEADENSEMGDALEEDTWKSAFQSGGSWKPDFADGREDRIILFGTASKEAQEFVYQIKASNLGTFTLPSVLAEAMYDRAVHALSASEGTIKVVAPHSK